MNDQSIRLFLALPLPKSLRNILSDWCSSKNAELPFQTWVHKDDYHITLKFLGDTPSSRLQEISDSLAPSLKTSLPFSLAVEGLGTFGPQQTPSIFWAGLSGDMEALKAIQRKAEDAMSAVGFAKEEKSYRPHITLARRYGGTNPFQKEWLVKAPFSSAAGTEWQVNQAVLYRSHLKRKPMYEALEVFPIGTNE